MSASSNPDLQLDYEKLISQSIRRFGNLASFGETHPTSRQLIRLSGIYMIGIKKIDYSSAPCYHLVSYYLIFFAP